MKGCNVVFSTGNHVPFSVIHGYLCYTQSGTQPTRLLSVILNTTICFFTKYLSVKDKTNVPSWLCNDSVVITVLDGFMLYEILQDSRL